MSSITITLQDGSEQSAPAGIRPIEVAESISKRQAKLWDEIQRVTGVTTASDLEAPNEDADRPTRPADTGRL